MRRPNIKWFLKIACITFIAATLFIILTGYLSASDYTNRLLNQHANVGHNQKLRQPFPVDQSIGNTRKSSQNDSPFQQPINKDHSENLIPEKEEEEMNKEIDEEDPSQTQEEGIIPEQLQQQQILPPNQMQKDWHDYTGMERDAKRVGFGEQGKRATNNDESTRDLERKMSLENGFNAYLSDMISVNRSVPDIRNKG